LPPRKSTYKVADIFESLGTVHAAIEIVDSRFTHWPDVDPLWLLADGMSHGCFVLGSGVPLTQRVLLDHGQYDLHLDGLEIASGAGDHPLPNPFATIASLATRLSQQGRGILAGDILTTGTFSGVTEVNAGQTATLKFHGIGECSVVVRA
jgi:2-keto-4-pentenoate hydratase